MRLLSGGRGLLVSGRPGAGKTTLAVHLMEAGFEYAADDIVLIASDGRVKGVPFALALKSGAWAMIEKLRPEIGEAAVHSRAGRQTRAISERPAHRIQRQRAGRLDRLYQACIECSGETCAARAIGDHKQADRRRVFAGRKTDPSGVSRN